MSDAGFFSLNWLLSVDSTVITLRVRQAEETTADRCMTSDLMTLMWACIQQQGAENKGHSDKI